ncbi:sigma-54-dependent Fis family transcriptional regulator [Alloalcanivorax mobilis]|uniref:sigma-54-dependent Fis family transcriptional regulator n=1 Tax=Alloalcanivorax mobilis TaxID=2019569 RepID=UPI000B5B2413|nr:sigma 54-interacting transcriptional regulator [Alloalcanivorax mobilis]ASK34387.1 sigma-54-dependent Fis family transcriptional regulator [Alcanivorax sp. N3-2A]|tara:strand:+ start:40858 stop:42474 length:1617 start_codon:yes stop_codon:yes gene_type:complete
MAGADPHALTGDTQTGDGDLTVLREAARLIGRAEAPELAISGILRLLSQMLGLNRARVMLPRIQDQGLSIRYAYGLTDEERARGVYEAGEGIAGRVMQSGQIAVVQDIDEDPMFLFRAVDRRTLPDEIVAYVAVPLMDAGVPMGVLAAHRLRQRPRKFDRDLATLQTVAVFIVQILKFNALLEERTATLRDENRQLKDALNSAQPAHGILGESESLREALRNALKVANTEVTVLLTGESGTGKERFSELLHDQSQRRDGPLLAINCAAIPEQLLESELFGHEKGAFTGATAVKKGKIEMADGGTLFLDEIGDMNPDLQSKLLRVLEKRMIQRVGGHRDIPVVVRIIAATHKNLQQAVGEGRFRLDLYYRLNVFPIHLPPLRERRGDVRLLTRHFLYRTNREYQRNVVLGPGVLERLESYPWPGNIRQLENIIRRAVLMARGHTLEGAELEAILASESSQTQAQSAPPAWPATTSPAPPAFAGEAEGLRPYRRVRAQDSAMLIQALQQAGGNKSRAARSLGMTPRQYRYHLDKLGLNPP